MQAAIGSFPHANKHQGILAFKKNGSPMFSEPKTPSDLEKFIKSRTSLKRSAPDDETAPTKMNGEGPNKLLKVHGEGLNRHGKAKEDTPSKIVALKAGPELMSKILALQDKPLDKASSNPTKPLPGKPPSAFRKNGKDTATAVKAAGTTQGAASRVALPAGPTRKPLPEFSSSVIRKPLPSSAPMVAATQPPTSTTGVKPPTGGKKITFKVKSSKLPET